ncbi:MAG: UDP-2,4-diacetamido-2,4,6-trideoxy-beta-L-altropyranose hydrolase [Clostridia bacterium]|jgi:UDP-2,4-diacetamido-2,4,6-trideoxy-beta-L-altropyranose hydrolase
MIGIRVDMNEKIATGHVMRCLAIASGLKNIGLDCLFITADENAKQTLNLYGFKGVCLYSQWDNLEIETNQLVNIIRVYKINKLIVDSYYVTEQYLQQLMNYTKVIYIDDMNFFRYPASMVINYNNYYEIFSYKKIYGETTTKLLLGCDYTPLREEFRTINYQFKEIVKRILITTGGIDQYNITGKLLKRIIAMRLFKDIEFHVVVGSFNKNIISLKKLSGRINSVILYQNIGDMSKLITSCDIAITAGGSTMYELCACGIPAISFSFADNQILGVKGFAKDGLIAYAGDARSNEVKCIANLIAYIEEYIKNPEDRKEKSINMRKKVDGNGVVRIVKAIVDLY